MQCRRLECAGLFTGRSTNRFVLDGIDMEVQQKILVVEDESSIADTIVYALNTEGFAATCCSNAADAFRYLDSNKPELIVLDVGLPDLSGFEVCRRIRQTSAVPILFLTARAEEVDRVLGFEIGGDDYVPKPFSPRELVARIRSILRRAGDKPQPAEAPRHSKRFRIDEERLKVFFDNTPLDLSRYEFRLFCVLIKRPGRVFSREELMNRAWEEPEMSLERTVDSHIKMIRAKLRAIDPADESIVTHRGLGYSLKEDA